MGWTKRQFAEKAFEKIGYASYTYDLQPEQILSAVQDMDSMIAGWNQTGIEIAYPMPGGPNDTDVNQETGVPNAANLAIYMNLGVLIAPGFGKLLAPEFKALAAQAYSNLLNWATRPVGQMCLPGRMPIGAGNKYWNSISYPFYGSYRYAGYPNGLGPTPGTVWDGEVIE